MQQVHLIYNDNHSPYECYPINPAAQDAGYLCAMRRQIRVVPPTQDNPDDEQGTVYLTHDAPRTTPNTRPSHRRWGLVAGVISGVLSLGILAELWSLLTAYQYGTAAFLLGAVIFGAYGLTHGGEEG